VGLPALSLLKRGPLAFLSSRQPVPAPLIDLLHDRLRAAARRRGGAGPEPTVAPGRGFAVVVTESAGGSGLLPVPQGLIALGLRGDAAARDLLPLLFPPGARSASTGGVTALASRESIPLAGEFDLWGAADGPSLLFATDPGLLAAAIGSGGAGGDAAIAEALPQAPDWRVDAIAEISMEKALPLLRRWAGPLSALLAARWPEAPDLTRDLDLAAALRTVRAVVGSDGKRDRSLVTLDFRDLK
jgi:hypothetical protein